MTIAITNSIDDRIAGELAAVQQLTSMQRKATWQALYKTAAPSKMSRALMVRSIAYRLQERAQGGLKPATRRLLERVAKSPDSSLRVKPMGTAVVSTGTVLLREWQGTTHEVTVLERGVIYHERRYRSLSEVARVITGSRWSGPLFFGLRTRTKEKDRDDQR